MNRYQVTIYSADRKSVDTRAYDQSTVTVSARSAIDAIRKATGRRVTDYTSAYADHANEAVRDNAHHQRTETGTTGAYAFRLDALQEIEKLHAADKAATEAYTKTPRPYWPFESEDAQNEALRSVEC